MTTLHSHSLNRTRTEDARRYSRRLLRGAELFTGISAVIGGALLVAAPDGSLLGADPTVLTGTAFTDWRLPGLLLATLVGVGFIIAQFWQRGPFALYVSVLVGAGLVAFEAVEFAIIGPHPLEAVFAIVGLLVVILAIRVLGERRVSK